MAVLTGMAAYTWTQYKHAYETDAENGVVKKERDGAKKAEARAIAAQQAEEKAKQDLQEQRDAARQAEEKTKKAEHLAAQRAVELAVNYGVQLQDPNREWNVAGSLVWFQEALRYNENDKNDPEQEKMDRLRLTATLAACPRPTRLWRFTDGPASYAEFSPDGRKVVGVGTGQDGQRRRCGTLQRGRLLATVQALPEGATKVHFGPDGSWLWADLGGKGKVWDAATGAERAGPWSKAATCLLSPDGARVADRWTPTRRPNSGTWGRGNGRRPAVRRGVVRVFSPNGGRFLTVGATAPLKRGRRRRRSRQERPFRAAGQEVYKAAFSQDGKLVVTFTKDAAVVWDLETGKEQGARGRQPARSSGPVSPGATVTFVTLDKSAVVHLLTPPVGPLKPAPLPHCVPGSGHPGVLQPEREVDSVAEAERFGRGVTSGAAGAGW